MGVRSSSVVLGARGWGLSPGGWLTADVTNTLSLYQPCPLWGQLEQGQSKASSRLSLIGDFFSLLGYDTSPMGSLPSLSLGFPSLNGERNIGESRRARLTLVFSGCFAMRLHRLSASGAGPAPRPSWTQAWKTFTGGHMGRGPPDRKLWGLSFPWPRGVSLPAQTLHSRSWEGAHGPEDGARHPRAAGGAGTAEARIVSACHPGSTECGYVGRGSCCTPTLPGALPVGRADPRRFHRPAGSAEGTSGGAETKARICLLVLHTPPSATALPCWEIPCWSIVFYPKGVETVSWVPAPSSQPTPEILS